MKKSNILRSTVTAVLIAASVSVPVFAASNPADDVTAYSYNAGKSSYETRMAEEHTWFDNKDDAETADYSFRKGLSATQDRAAAFAELPENPTDEELAAFFEKHQIGSGSAWTDGVYNEDTKSGYGFQKGLSSWQERQAQFE